MSLAGIEIDDPIGRTLAAWRARSPVRHRRAVHELREAVRAAEQRHADKLVEIREALAESEVYLAEVCELRGELMTALGVSA